MREVNAASGDGRPRLCKSGSDRSQAARRSRRDRCGVRLRRLTEPVPPVRLKEPCARSRLALHTPHRSSRTASSRLPSTAHPRADTPRGRFRAPAGSLTPPTSPARVIPGRPPGPGGPWPCGFSGFPAPPMAFALSGRECQRCTISCHVRCRSTRAMRQSHRQTAPRS